MTFVTPVDGQPAIAEHVAQITETLNGTRPIPVSLTNSSLRATLAWPTLPTSGIGIELFNDTVNYDGLYIMAVDRATNAGAVLNVAASEIWFGTSADLNDIGGWSHISSDGKWHFGSNLLWDADSINDIGAAGARPRDVHVARYLFVGNDITLHNTQPEILFGTDTLVALRRSSATNFVLENYASPGTTEVIAGTIRFTSDTGPNRWQINSSGHLLAGADNTYDIGASAASRPRTIYVGTSVVTPVVVLPAAAGGPSLRFSDSSTTGIYSPAATEVAISSGNVQKLRITSSATTVSGNLTAAGVVTINDQGYNTPSLLNNGYSRFNGRVGFGSGGGGHDPIALVFIGANNPPTSLMTGGNQYMFMQEYWANSLGTGMIKGMEIGVLGSASGSGEVQIANFKGVGKQGSGNINYAKEVVINAQNPGVGSVENIGLEIGDQSGASSRNLSIWCKGPALFEKDVTHGTGSRILGDFSSGMISNRTIFQAAATNVQTEVGIMPNGTGNAAFLEIFTSSDVNNSGHLLLGCQSTQAYIGTYWTGTGASLPISFQTAGNERMRIDTTGDVGLGYGGAQMATNQTTGFLWVPSMPGPPTVNPSQAGAIVGAGRVALMYDSGNHRLYISVGGTVWKYVGLI